MTMSHWEDQSAEAAEITDTFLGVTHPYCVVLWDPYGAGWVVTGPFATREEAVTEARECAAELGAEVETHIGRWFDVRED